MPRYKRSAVEAELDTDVLGDARPSDPSQDETLKKLRSMWEFASFMQFIFIFGGALKIDEDFDIEDLEHECLQPYPSSVLAEMGLTLLKYVSSHRGLTHDIFSEYTRRQYLAKAPTQNPFGDDEDPILFNDLDIYTRIRVLHQLSIWTFNNPDRMRSLMPENEDHLDWRIEPLGWDADDRSYFVLDDNRLYRRTDEPIPEPPPKPKAASKPKAKSKAKAKGKKMRPRQIATPNRATRASKRRRVDDTPEAEEEVDDDDEAASAEDETEAQQDADVTMSNGALDVEDEPGYGFTAKTWECVAITLPEYQDFLATIQKSRDPNEKTLRKRIESEVLPVIEKRAEALRVKQLKRLRELENLQKLATAKRSGRLADKAERIAKEQEEREAEEKRAAQLRMAREEQERQRRIEEGHESRRLTREQRLKERESKRILHEEELQRLEQEAALTASNLEADDAERKRLSSRNLQNQREAHRKELDRLELDQEEDKWYFDCVVCGMHGENLDDGSHSVACERCNVWQHSTCHGFTPEQCEDTNFHFICKSCRKKEKAELAAKAAKDEQRSGVVLKLGKRSTAEPSASTAVNGESPRTEITTQPIKREIVLPDYVQKQLAGITQQNSPPQPQHRPQDIPAGQPSTSRPLSSSTQHGSPPHPQIISQQQWHHGASVPALTPSRPTEPRQYQTQPMQASLPDHAHQHSWMHSRAVNGSGGHPPEAVMQSTQQRPPSQRYLQSSPPQPGLMQPQADYRMFSPQPRSLQAQPVQHHPYQMPTQHHQSTHQNLHQAQPMSNGTAQPSYRMPSGSPGSMLHTPLVPREQKAPSPLQSSPHTNIPPPSTDYNRNAAISPEKSSPPRSTAQASPATVSTAVMNGQHHQGPALMSHQALTTPSTSFENAPKLATPNKNAVSPAPPSTTGDGLAASGMQGPWPTGSMSVPQKPAASASSPSRTLNGGQ